MINKAQKWHIWLISGIASLIIFLVVFFVAIKPANDDAASLASQAAGIEGTGGTQEAVVQHQGDLRKAKSDAVKAKVDWQVNSVKYMPQLPFSKSDKPGDLINIYEFRSVDGKPGFKSVPTVWGTWITNWYKAQHKDGVDLAPGTSFPIPAYSSDPNQLSDISYLTFPSAATSWNVAVYCKTFSDALAHLKRFNSMRDHGMPVIDNISLTGHSPDLLLTYSLRLYVIPGQMPPAQDPRIQLSSGSAGGGRGMGGMGMGMMGGPPGMMGGPPGMMGPGGPPAGMMGPGGPRGKRGAPSGAGGMAGLK